MSDRSSHLSSISMYGKKKYAKSLRSMPQAPSREIRQC